MQARMKVAMWRPVDKRLWFRRAEIGDRALLDNKREEAWQATQPCIHRIRVRSRLFPWRVDDIEVVVAQDGDAELLDLEAADADYHNNRTPRLTRQIRLGVSKEATYAVIAHAGATLQRKSPLHPLIVAAEVAVLIVVGMLGWSFIEAQESLPFLAPTFGGL